MAITGDNKTRMLNYAIIDVDFIEYSRFSLIHIFSEGKKRVERRDTSFLRFPT